MKEWRNLGLLCCCHRVRKVNRWKNVDLYTTSMYEPFYSTFKFHSNTQHLVHMHTCFIHCTLMAWNSDFVETVRHRFTMVIKALQRAFITMAHTDTHLSSGFTLKSFQQNSWIVIHHDVLDSYSRCTTVLRPWNQADLSLLPILKLYFNKLFWNLIKYMNQI